MANFQDLLNKKREDIEAPIPLPEGEYRCQVAGVPEMGESQQKKTPYARFTYNVIEPMPSVDAGLVAAAGIRKKDGSPRQLGRDDYYLTDESEFILKQHLDQILGEGNWETLGDGLKMVPGRDVIVTLGYDIDKEDSSKKYPQVRKVIGIR